jgi:hypothetical protein
MNNVQFPARGCTISAIKFPLSVSGEINWKYRHSTVPALAAIFALQETRKVDPNGYFSVLATDAEGIRQAAISAHDLASEVSDWISTITILGESHLDRFDDSVDGNEPSKADVALARRAFLTLESIRELHAMLHEFVGMAADAKPGIGGANADA